LQEIRATEKEEEEESNEAKKGLQNSVYIKN
jgi:hypothetical protein